MTPKMTCINCRIATFRYSKQITKFKNRSSVISARHALSCLLFNEFHYFYHCGPPIIADMKTSPFYKLIRFDEFSATPKYQQLANSIIKAIEDGKLQVD